MQSLFEWWDGVMSIQGARWIIYPALLAVLLLFAYYVISLVRNLAIGGSPAGDYDYLGEFRRMRDEGHLDQDEYKKLTGLVPLPDAESGAGNPVDDEGGARSLADAAKEAIRRAAAKKQSAGDDPTNAQKQTTTEGNSDDDEHSAD